jgi:hypothetical protein
MDATRFDQFGRWSASSLILTARSRSMTPCASAPKTVHGACAVSANRRARGAPVRPGGICFIWAPLFWDDHITHAIFFDGSKGEALVREESLRRCQEAAVGRADSTDERMATARHRIAYHRGTRLASAADIDLVNLAGETRTISLEPILKFQMKGLGYSHPEWGQGMWKGEAAFVSESFDPRQLDMLARENLHVQQVVIANDGTRKGIGVLEQIVAGPYAPAGFKDYFDGAST